MSDDEQPKQNASRRTRYPRPKGAGPAGRPQRTAAPQSEHETERPAKQDTSGGIKVKLRGGTEEGGLLSAAELRQELNELADRIDQYPQGTLFKWATFYATPVDQAGNSIKLDGVPKNQTITPYKSAADEFKF